MLARVTLSSRLAVVLVVGGLGGCTLLEMSAPETRLSDVVYQLNDEARWGRVDLAAQRVAPEWRARFLAQHRRWGRDVRVADADVTNMELGLPDDRAASVVTYSWIDERTMELSSTTVRQIWESNGEGFRLVREEIAGGDPALLVRPEMAPDSEEGEYDEGSGDEILASSDDPDDAALPPSGETDAPAATRQRRRDSQGVLVD